VTSRCFPAALGWEGRDGFVALAARQLDRLETARTLDAQAAAAAAADGATREPRLPDPGLARFRMDGELHLFAPRIVSAIQALANSTPSSDMTADPLPAIAGPSSEPSRRSSAIG